MSIPALKGDWAIAKGRIIQKWAKLTDGNLHRSAGRPADIAHQIQKRTGERHDDLADALKEAQARGPVKRLPETTQPGRKQEI